MLYLSNSTYTPFHSVFESVVGMIHQYDLRNYCACTGTTPRGAPSDENCEGSLTNTHSRRTPDYHTIFNAADEIDRGLAKTNDNTWGFVIYRGTYADNNDWTEFLARLHQSMEETLSFSNGLDMLDYFSLTVREDPIRFNNANTSVIRNDFDIWAADQADLFIYTPERGMVHRSQRYEVCIYVDQESLDSILHEQEEKQVGDMGFSVQGWVKFILRDVDWEFRPRDPPMDEEEVEEEFEPIEGNTSEDVGWMRVDYQDVMVTYYNLFDNWNNWHTLYRRPPEIAQS